MKSEKKSVIVGPNKYGHYGYYKDIINNNLGEHNFFSHSEIGIKFFIKNNVGRLIVLNYWSLLKAKPLTYIVAIFCSSKIYQYIYNIDFLYKENLKSILILLLNNLFTQIFHVKIITLVEHEKNNKYSLTYSTDPIVKTNFDYEIGQFKKKINIPDAFILLFGSHDYRKGTYNFIKNIPDDVNLLIVGKIHDKRIFDFKDKKNIYIHPEFVSEGFKNYLFEESKAVAIPYISWYGSSGVLGYAILHKKAIIGPNKYFIGTVLQSYNKSILIDSSAKLTAIASHIDSLKDQKPNSEEVLKKYFNKKKFIEVLKY